mmetsp:Transcript_37445/g.83322  ORF Transcript_37445/g.83322 Transcript_37445/m.83322 type:complete len:221 (+) Transcript_37445:776-1438(+)
MLHQVSPDLLISHIGVVLGGDQNGMNPHRVQCTGAVRITLVLNGHLGLAIRPQPGAHTVLADLSQLVTQLGSQDVGQGHQLRGLISCIAKHVALVTSADILQGLGVHAVHRLTNIWGLLLNVDQDLALVSIQAHIVRGEANLPYGLAHNGLVVNLGLGSNLAEYHHHVGLGAGLAGNLGIWILSQHSVQHGVGHLVAKLVRMSLIHRLAGEQKSLESRHI